jgi:hypothetical protein
MLHTFRVRIYTLPSTTSNGFDTKFISKLDRLSIHSSFPLEPRHRTIPQNQPNSSFAERKQIAERGFFCRMHLKKPSFRRTDFSPGWTHKSDSLPNFGVNSEVCSGSPENHWVTRLSHKTEAEDSTRRCSHPGRFNRPGGAVRLPGLVRLPGPV